MTRRSLESYLPRDKPLDRRFLSLSGIIGLSDISYLTDDCDCVFIFSLVHLRGFDLNGDGKRIISQDETTNVNFLGKYN